MTFPVECPNCGKTFQAVNGLVGKEAKCKKCQRVFTVEAPKGPEPPPLPVPPHSTYIQTAKRASINGMVLTGALLGFAGAFVGTVAGVLLAEFMPLFGGFLATVAEPFSEYRNSLVLGHVLFCATSLGAFGAAAGSALWMMSKR